MDQIRRFVSSTLYGQGLLGNDMSYNSEFLRTKISHLRLGKLSDSLNQKYGILNLNDLSDLGELLTIYESKSVNKTLETLFKSTNCNEIGWRQYCSINGFFINVKNQNQDFRTHPNFISDKIRALIPHITTWSNCTEVFDYRTSKRSKERLTLKECSIRVLNSDRLGPQVARIEKHLLEKLSKTLVYRDFSHCKAFIDKDLLDFIEKSTQIYLESNNGFNDFRHKLEHSCKNSEDLGGLPHLLWSIIDGLPPNRYYHLSTRKRADSRKPNALKFSQRKIKLKGFKKVF